MFPASTSPAFAAANLRHRPLLRPHPAKVRGPTPRQAPGAKSVAMVRAPAMRPQWLNAVPASPLLTHPTLAKAYRPPVQPPAAQKVQGLDRHRIVALGLVVGLLAASAALVAAGYVQLHHFGRTLGL